MPTLSATLDNRISAVRRFSRFYTRQLGLLQEGLVRTRYSLTEGRVLYELAHRDRTTASELAAALDLDHGYLSRILRRFAEDGLLAKKRAADDARQSLITITAKGRKAFAPLNKGSYEQVSAMLGQMSEAEQQRVVDAMGTIETSLGASAGNPAARTIILRGHQPGDMGWVTSAHGALYAQEYSWDITFEALVAKITAEFIENFDAKRERCWIAELDGERVGSAFVVRKTDEIAKLRLLIIDPRARGLKLGVRLVDECLRFAKSAGYSSMTLWTQANLYAARGIYQRAGFTMTAAEPNHSFGVDLVSETWDIDLRDRAP